MSESIQLTLITPEEDEAWPRHTEEMWLGDGTHIICHESFPVGKIAETGYCRYCYETHSNWWLMDQDNYRIEGETIILCGECEYTSAAEFAAIEKAETPLEALHRIWRKVTPEDRAKFLIEMLTPAERRLISTGLCPDEEPTP